LTLKDIDGLSIYRPVQYLGAKIRTLPAIIEATDYLLGSNGTCLDLFSGSSVVSQTLHAKGLKVIGNDALRFSFLITHALISNHQLSNVEKLLSRFVNSDSELHGIEKKISAEKNAINKKDPTVLIKQNIETLMDWDKKRLNLIASLNETEKWKNTAVLLYSGTYFGFNQAKHIDLIRSKIFDLIRKKNITLYEYSLLMTALFSTISQSVFSAGKHFAQPHLIKTEKNLPFISKRIIQDRSYDVLETFKIKVKELVKIKSESKNNDSYATNENLESLVKNRKLEKIDLIYADPPYTAQQYSRFYHIPEVLSEDKFPELQLVNGKVTRGIYPVDRFKSKFCSKKTAHEAFEDIFLLSKKYDSSLILSYSLSKNSATGNERMISLDKLLDLSRKFYGKNVHLIEFAHTYRQFNNIASVVNKKEDKEIQIVCKK